LKNGIILEAKGVLDAETIRKLRAVKKAHPHRDIRLVFMRPGNRLRPGSKTTYARWAERNGFPWCGPAIPKEWLRAPNHPGPKADASPRNRRPNRLRRGKG
jgi:hypothetical protein